MCVETLYKALAAHPDFEKTDLSCFRWMINGAAPITKKTLEIYWGRDVRLFNAYGMTEIGPSNIAPPLNEISLAKARGKWNSVGIPMYFNNIRIVDEKGEKVRQGEVGELIAKSPLQFSGYWNDNAQSQAIQRNGWIYTGDIACVDQDGYYYICGRKKNMFISGGENIFPLEIERVISSHPSIDSAVVIGVPDDRWGEVGKAVVVLKNGNKLTKEELRQFLLGEDLSRIKIPKYVQFVESLPLNSVGKLDFGALRELCGRSSDD
jgi:fatty-acyl-CoA synthase